MRRGRFAETVRFELAYYLRRTSTWVYFAIFLSLGVMLMAMIGGAFPGVNAAVGGSGGNVKVNGPYVTMVIVATVGMFAVLVIPALVGNAVYRDYESGIHPLFFAAPVSRASYLGGRLVGVLLVAAVIFSSIPLGVWLGGVMPFLDAERLGPFHVSSYVQPYLLIVLPNVLFTGALFFSLAALTRRMLPNYVGGVLLLVGYLAATSLAGDVDNQRMAAMVDPFGLGAMGYVTQYWTPAERNTLLLPFSGLVLWNRLLWMGVGLLVFAAVFARFRFAHVAPERVSRRKRRAMARMQAAEAGPAHARPVRLSIPPARRDFGRRMHWAQYLSSARRGFREVVANRYFAAMAAAGAILLVWIASEQGKILGTSTWPVTYQVINTLGGTFTLLVIAVITFFGGELVWRERDARMHQVTDATPVPTWVPLAAKATALAGVVVVLQAVLLVAGVLSQAAKGYYRFELGLYVKALFGVQMVEYLLFGALVLLVHTLANNKYLGHLVVMLYFVFSLFSGQLGLEHNLLRYASDAGMTYSDMNGYGPFAAPWAWFKLYWAGWALLFAVLSNLFWVRGQETAAAWRVRLARLRFRRPALVAFGAAAVMILGLGGFIFYNTNVLNEYSTSFQGEERMAEYERLYKRFENAPQPRIVGTRLDVDLFPETRGARLRGEYRLRNGTAVPVDSIHLRIPREVEARRLAFSRPARRVLDDRAHGYAIWKLDTPLQPGDSLRLAFDIEVDNRGFENQVSMTQLVDNGTFFNNQMVLPSLGYDASSELGDDEVRRKHGLRPRERMAPATDTVQLRRNQLSGDADWIDFEATVSTSADQTAVAPGYLQREWTSGGRRYFHYKMDAPILNFYSFLSARYAVRRDHWRGPDGRDVAIEIYYHPGHEYNLDRMVDGIKQSLSLYTRAFGPYQFRQVRILEFPRYASFAQSFPNTIPYSEAIGFIARVRDKNEDVDYPFYVTAHEVAHQWWAHQVIGANVQGGTMLVETLAEYSALLVMQKELGPVQVKRFLRYNLDEYLQGRTFERKKEMPLARVENQQYIHYRKGSLAMFALADYLGADVVNGALARFLAEHRFEQPPYATAEDLLRHLRAAAPDSMRYLVTDLFETITLWNDRAKSATATRLPDGRYRVTLEVEAHKVRVDSIGNEREIPMNDLVEVGVFAAPEPGQTDGAPLYLAKHRVRTGSSSITVEVRGKPARAGIDPLFKLIDRDTRDNTVPVTEVAAKKP